MIGPAHEGGHSVHEPHAAGQVERCVTVSVADERVGIGLEEILHHLLLPGEDSQVEGRLGEGGRGREGGREGEGERGKSAYHKLLT